MNASEMQIYFQVGDLAKRMGLTANELLDEIMTLPINVQEAWMSLFAEMARSYKEKMA